MARGPFPPGWVNKRVTILLNTQGQRLWGKVTEDNEGGCVVELEGQGTPEEDFLSVRRVFIPWYAVRYIELLEEPEGSSR